MISVERVFFGLGSLSALMSVGAGAFGAHAMKMRLAPDLLAAFETGARYQMYHALALIAVAWATARWPGPILKAAGLLFLLGTLLFSGSLYALSLTGMRALGAITPLGGLAFMVGWGCLVWTAFRSQRIGGIRP